LIGIFAWLGDAQAELLFLLLGALTRFGLLRDAE
jgi:hypothetical protein